MSKGKKYVYEVVEKDEVNPLNDKFVKKNVDVEFTMQQMLDYEQSADKAMVEYNSKMALEEAKMKNVENHHMDAVDLVKSLEPVKQEAIKIWLNSHSIVDQLGEKRDELQKAIDEHKAEIKVIKEQTGWTPPALEDNEPSDDTINQEEPDGATGESDQS